MGIVVSTESPRIINESGYEITIKRIIDAQTRDRLNQIRAMPSPFREMSSYILQTEAVLKTNDGTMHTFDSGDYIFYLNYKNRKKEIHRGHVNDSRKDDSGHYTGFKIHSGHENKISGAGKDDENPRIILNTQRIIRQIEQDIDREAEQLTAKLRSHEKRAGVSIERAKQAYIEQRHQDALTEYDRCEKIYTRDIIPIINNAIIQCEENAKLLKILRNAQSQITNIKREKLTAQAENCIQLAEQAISQQDYDTAWKQYQTVIQYYTEIEHLLVKVVGYPQKGFLGQIFYRFVSGISDSEYDFYEDRLKNAVEAKQDMQQRMNTLSQQYKEDKRQLNIQLENLQDHFNHLSHHATIDQLTELLQQYITFFELVETHQAQYQVKIDTSNAQTQMNHIQERQQQNAVSIVELGCGHRFFDKGEYHRARQFYKKSKHPIAPVYFNLTQGKIAESIGNNENAESFYGTALSLSLEHKLPIQVGCSLFINKEKAAQAQQVNKSDYIGNSTSQKCASTSRQSFRSKS